MSNPEAPMARQLAWWCPLALAAAFGCGNDGGGGGDLSGTATNATSATMGDPSDSNADEGGATDSGPPPPEEEDEGDFRVPRASGKYLYSASQTTDSVAVIDTATLVIDVVEVGQGPTVVQPIPGQSGDAGSVVVLDQGSDDIAVLRTDDAGTTSVTLFPVTAGANNLAVAPDGAHVVVYHDFDGPEQLGPGSDQELTVLDVAAGTTHAMTVGAHPRDVVFSTDHTTAWVITAAGVNVIAFADLAIVGKPPLLPVVADPGIDPATIEVQVSASQGIALARVFQSPWVAVTDLADGTLTVLDLPGAPTDLDLAPSGDFAVLTISDIVSSTFLELPLPLEQGGELTATAVDGEYVGQSAIAPSGDAILLFTTVNPNALTAAPSPVLRAPDEPAFADTTGTTGTTGDDTTGTTADPDTTTDNTTTADPPPNFDDPRQRITLARREGNGWSLVTQFVEVPVTSVGVAPDSLNAILVHASDPATPAAPWSYSLFDLTPKFPLLKRQNTQAEPGTVLFTPDGDRAAVLLRDDAQGVRKVDLVDLGNFIVAPLLLGSPPEGAGYVDATAKVYVSQTHPTGRITFVGPTGDVQTVTGYVLNDSVKD
jgi:YVTN family beta-propeller protein